MLPEHITINLPEPLARELETANQEFLVEVLHRGLQSLKIEQALNLYARGGITFGAAAHQAGVTQSEFARHAYAGGMDAPFSEETMIEELK